jgi:hypothetical protein
MALWRTTALLPSPFSSTSTAATGCGWRRLISDGSGQTQDLVNPNLTPFYNLGFRVRRI